MELSSRAVSLQKAHTGLVLDSTSPHSSFATQSCSRSSRAPKVRLRKSPPRHVHTHAHTLPTPVSQNTKDKMKTGKKASPLLCLGPKKKIIEGLMKGHDNSQKFSRDAGQVIQVNDPEETKATCWRNNGFCHTSGDSAETQGSCAGVRPPRGAAFLRRCRAAAQLPGKTKGKEISSVIRK